MAAGPKSHASQDVPLSVAGQRTAFAAYRGSFSVTPEGSGIRSGIQRPVPWAQAES